MLAKRSKFTHDPITDNGLIIEDVSDSPTVLTKTMETMSQRLSRMYDNNTPCDASDEAARALALHSYNFILDVLE